MVNRIKEYIALFEYVEGQSGYSVVFPDFPGCITSGDDFDDTYKMAIEALSLHTSDGEKIPEPRSLEEIQKNWEYWDEWKNNYTFEVVRVPLFQDNMRTARVNVTIPINLLNRIDSVTNNRSAFLAAAAEKLLNG